MDTRVITLMALLCSTPAIAVPCLTYDCQQMLTLKNKIQQGDNLYLPAYQALLKNADNALQQKPGSVVDKTLLPASGDKHDYYSFGPYWWPNPDTPDSLPYIRKDGQINPSSKTDDTDSKRMVQFSDAVRTLSLAAFYSGDRRYGEKAKTLLNTWFVQKTTRMNPNLNYAQAIPGVVNGRGIGIIDTRVLIDVADSLILLKNADYFTAKEFSSYQAWYADYSQWLQSSPNGKEEADWYNNHGAWYDAQLTAFLLFAGDTQHASQQINTFKYRHLAAQVNKKGELQAELERTRSFHYTNFALAAYAKMGRYGELTGNDVWNFELDGRTMKKAFTLVSQQALQPASAWHYPEIKYTPEEALGPLLIAARAWKDKAFQHSAAGLLATDKTNINILTPGSALVK